MECLNGFVFKVDFVFGNNSDWLWLFVCIFWVNLDIYDFMKI